MHATITQFRNFRQNAVRGRLFVGDALAFLKSLPDDSAQIVFLDPPFNLGKEYAEGDSRLDRTPEGQYESWLRDVVSESSRVLNTGGSLFLYHLPRWAMSLGAYLQKGDKVQFLHWIAISMKNGFVRGKRLYPAHYALLMFTKGSPTPFRRPKLLPKTCRKCGELIKDYGGYRSIIEAKGINLSDFWEDLSPVRHSNRKNRSANELPELLFSRILEMSGSKGGVYVDPFAGSGTGVVTAVRYGMRFVACDLVKQNCELIVSRLDRGGNT